MKDYLVALYRRINLMTIQLVIFFLIVHLCSPTIIKWPKNIDANSLEADFVRACLNGDTDYIKIALALKTMEDKSFPDTKFPCSDDSPADCNISERHAEDKLVLETDKGIISLPIENFSSWFELGCGLASLEKRHKTLKLLLNSYSNAAEYIGRATVLACMGGDFRVFKYLMKMSGQGITVEMLSEACKANKLSIIKWSIKIANLEGNIPDELFLIALEYENPRAIRFLAGLTAGKPRPRITVPRDFFSSSGSEQDELDLDAYTIFAILRNDKKTLARILSARKIPNCTRNMLMKVACCFGTEHAIFKLLIKYKSLSPLFKTFISRKVQEHPESLLKLSKACIRDFHAVIYCSFYWNNPFLLKYMLKKMKNNLQEYIAGSENQKLYLGKQLGYALQAAIWQGNYEVIKIFSKSKLMQLAVDNLPYNSLSLTDSEKILRILERFKPRASSLKPKVSLDGIYSHLAKAEWNLIHTDLDSDNTAHESHHQSHNVFELAIVKMEQLGYSTASINILREFQANLIVLRHLRLSGLPPDLLYEKFSLLSSWK